MNTVHEGAGASASAPLCIEVGCPEPRLTFKRRGASSYCASHAVRAMFGPEDEDDAELETREEVDPNRVFRDEVRRRRIARESAS